MSQTNLLRKQSGAFPKRMSVASHLKLLHGRSISCAFCKCQLQTHEAQTQREIVGVVQRSSSNAYRNTFHNPRRRDVPANQRLFASQIACTQLRRESWSVFLSVLKYGLLGSRALATCYSLVHFCQPHLIGVRTKLGSRK